MRKLFGFIIGLIVMLGVFASLYLAGAIYDTADLVKIEPYFLRLGLRANEQIGNIKTLPDVQNKKLRDWLVQKYVREYLYIEPDEDNIAMRMKRGPLWYMSSDEMFAKWQRGEAENIRDAAARGIRRTVFVFDEILAEASSDYLRVDYETKTWYKPNDITEAPTISRGTMYLKIKNIEHGIKVQEPIDKVTKALADGIDPAVVFTFYVDDVIDEKQ